MGAQSSKSQSVELSSLGWDMTTSPKNISIVTIPEQTNKIVIICPIQGHPNKQIKINHTGLLSFDLVTKKIYEVYKPYKGRIDHVFFEGLELINVKGKTAYFKINTGS